MAKPKTSERDRIAHNKKILAGYSDEKLRQLLWDHTSGISIYQGYRKPSKGINDMNRQELLDFALALTGGI